MSTYEVVTSNEFLISQLAEIYESDRAEIIDYFNLTIKVGYHRLHLYRIAYLDRKHTKSPVFPHQVKRSSFDESRKNIIIAISEFIIERYQLGYSNRTIHTNVLSQISFIDWVDTNKYSFPSELKSAKKCYILYSNYISHLYKTKFLSSSYAKTKQSSCASLLSYVLKIELYQITSGIRPLKKVEADINHTAPASKGDLEKHLLFFSSLFNEITDNLLNDTPLPFYINLPDESLWVFPGLDWCAPHFRRDSITGSVPGISIAWDLDKGKLRDKYQISEITGKNNSYSLRNIKSAQETLIKSQERSSPVRLRLAHIACKAYFMLFLIETGMNDTSASHLAWSDDYKIERDTYGFKIIKPRAGNKEVEFHLQSTALKDFEKYLKIRNLFLTGKEFSHLFFRYERNTYKPTEISFLCYSSVILNLFIKTVSPTLPRITSRVTRVSKSKFLMDEVGPDITSKVMQSSTETILKNYTAGNQIDTDIEFSDFFNQLNYVILDTTDKNLHLTETSVGQCSSHNNPKVVSPIEIDADCSTMHGCLYCDKYRVHAISLHTSLI